VTPAEEDIAEAIDHEIQHEGESRNPNDKKEQRGTVLEK
jgi:hypothetical protein